VDAVLADYRTAGISPKLSALLTLVEKIARDATGVTREDVDRARAAGWSDEAVYDAIAVCALFKFYTTWVDAHGVNRLSPEAYSASGQRLATDGYRG
jgi:hypothetical protein